MNISYIFILVALVIFNCRANETLTTEWEKFTTLNDIKARDGLSITRKFFDDRVNQIELKLKRSPEFYSSLDPSIKSYVVASIMSQAIRNNDFVTLHVCLTTCPQKYIWNQPTWYVLSATDGGVMFYALFGACHEVNEDSINYAIIVEIIKDSMPNLQFPLPKNNFISTAKSSYKSITNLEKLVSDYTFISQDAAHSEYGIEDYIKFFEKREARMMEIQNKK